MALSTQESSENRMTFTDEVSTKPNLEAEKLSCDILTETETKDLKLKARRKVFGFRSLALFWGPFVRLRESDDSFSVFIGDGEAF